MPRILKRPMFSRGGRIGLAEGDPNPGMMGGLGSALPKEKYKPDLMTIKATLNQVYTNAGGSEDGSGYAAVLNFMKENPEYKVQILENMIGDKGNQIRVAPLEKESVNILDSLNEDMDGIIKIDMDKLGYAEGKTQAEIYADEYYDQLSKIQPNSRLSEKDIQRQLMMNPSEPNSRLSEKDIQRQQLLQESNKGIMTGLVDRTEKNQGGRIGYAEGKTQAEIYADEIYDQLSKIQPPKPKFNLGEFGMNLASGKYAGDGFVSSLVGSGREPYSKFTAADDKRRNLDYTTKMAAAKMGISKADAEAAAKAKALATGKIPTSKKARNTSDQVINGVAPGKIGFFTNQMINALGGKLTPIDERMMTLPNGNVIPYEEYKKTETKKDLATEVGSSVQTVFEIKNDMLSRLKNTPTGLVGSVFGVFEGVSDQFSQATQALGFNKDSLDFDVNTSEKLDAYLEGKGITRGAANFATMKGSAINLAYMLAKIKEPGNPKLSEGDIIRQMDRIRFGASRDVFAAGLNQIFEEELLGARGLIRGYGLKPEDYLNFDAGEKDEKDEKDEKNKKDDGDPLGILS